MTFLPCLQVLSKKKLQDLVREIDPNEQLDEDVEEVPLITNLPLGVAVFHVAILIIFKRVLVCL